MRLFLALGVGLTLVFAAVSAHAQIDIFGGGKRVQPTDRIRKLLDTANALDQPWAVRIPLLEKALAEATKDKDLAGQEIALVYLGIGYGVGGAASAERSFRRALELDRQLG